MIEKERYFIEIYEFNKYSYDYEIKRNEIINNKKLSLLATAINEIIRVMEDNKELKLIGLSYLIRCDYTENGEEYYTKYKVYKYKGKWKYKEI